jgi:hypothetical protein
MFKVLGTYIFWKKIYEKEHLDGSGAWPSYIYDARFLKVKSSFIWKNFFFDASGTKLRHFITDSLLLLYIIYCNENK